MVMLRTITDLLGLAASRGGLLGTFALFVLVWWAGQWGL